MLTLTDTTISGNSAAQGGGIRSSTFVGGLTLTNTTINNNTASGDGGGIFDQGGTATLKNTIVSNSPSGGDCSGIITSSGHNLDSDGSCGLTGTGDLSSTNPLLGSLADNGGSTLTHALLPGSPAIDAGDDTAAPPTDQRGVARPKGAASDIGAYERFTVAFTLATSSGSESVTPANLEDTLSAASGQQESVDFTVGVTGSTATGGGADFTLASGTLTFSPGDTSKTIAITIGDDTLDEAAETIAVTLSNPNGATLGSITVHTYTIEDGDPTLTLAPNSAERGDVITVELLDYPAGISIDLIEIAGLNATPPGLPQTGPDGGVFFGFLIPAISNDGITIPIGSQPFEVFAGGVSQKTTLTILPAVISVSDLTIVANQDLTITGSGLFEGGGVCVVEGHITLSNVPLEIASASDCPASVFEQPQVPAKESSWTTAGPLH